LHFLINGCSIPPFLEVLNDPNYWIDAEDDDEEFRLEEDEEENDQQEQQEEEEEQEEHEEHEEQEEEQREQHPEQDPERRSPEPSPYNTRSRCQLTSVEIDEIARLLFLVFPFCFLNVGF